MRRDRVSIERGRDMKEADHIRSLGSDPAEHAHVPWLNDRLRGRLGRSPGGLQVTLVMVSWIAVRTSAESVYGVPWPGEYIDST